MKVILSLVALLGCAAAEDVAKEKAAEVKTDAKATDKDAKTAKEKAAEAKTDAKAKKASTTSNETKEDEDEVKEDPVCGN